MAETTTRAYTLRLAEACETKWREHVWNTHCTVNRGVWVWGDWLLTLRGSLPADLAHKHPERRVVLALSWLSVESPESLVPKDKIVAKGSDACEERNEKVVTRFRAILKQLRVTNPEEWVESCGPALEARIRKDAVWVDRSSCFHELAKTFKGKLSPEWATEMFFDLIGGEAEYFLMPDLEGEASSEAKDFVIKAGNWLSTNWGSGAKSDSSSIAEKLGALVGIRSDRVAGRNALSGLGSLVRSLDGEVEEGDDVEALEKKLKQLVGWKGRPSKGAMALAKLVAAKTISKELWAEVRKKFQEEAADQLEKSAGGPVPEWMPRLRGEIEARIEMPFRTTKDHIWEYAVMLDHALRRVSAAHTWIKRAEASRQKFQANAAKITDVPAQAIDWLDKYCDERSRESGAIEEYLIRQRAIDGWPEVVRAWKKCKDDRQSRIDAARLVQKNWPESKKFGDIQLFSGFGEAGVESPLLSLADDEAKCAWHNDLGKVDDSILTKYVAARLAEHDQRRFKVPAYRHPDPLRHPVWVDFGNSRWDIGYAALEAVQTRGRLQQKLAKAKTDVTRKKTEEQLAAKPDISGVTLRLWNGENFESVPLRWQSKRLRNNLALGQAEATTGPVVSRADRFGRAAAGSNGGAVTVAEVFNQKDWSGRLQANRAELDRLADLVYGKTERKKLPPSYEVLDKPLIGPAAKRWGQLRWFLSYSAKLLPNGPWLNDIVPKLPDGWEWKKGRSGEFLKIAANEKRTGPGSQRTRLKLARLPVRVLSFDLGHRYAAACAVWGRGISTKSMDALCKEADKVVRDAGDLYRHLKYKTEKRDKKSGKVIFRTVVWRRIGPDKLAGKSDHPTAWVPLERQFVIKLQGENEPARFPHDNERTAFHEHYKTLTGLDDEHAEKTADRKRVDALMSLADDEVRAALWRHGDVARIANAFLSPIKQLAGGRSYNFFADNPGIAGDTPDKRAENYRHFLLDAIVAWHELKSGHNRNQTWEHAAAERLWTKYVAHRIEDGGNETQVTTDDETPIERKSRLKSLGPLLTPVAAELASDAKLRAILAGEFSDIWRVEETQWLGEKGHLRWLRCFILPRLGKKPKRTSPEYDAWKRRAIAIRHVGGLSIDRIATILKLYQIMRAFHTRPEPDNLRAGIEKIERESESEFRFGQRILDTLDQLRENRIKQLASRLVEAALGIGSEDAKRHWEGGTKRPRRRIDDPRFLPCEVIIGEDLEDYRPEQTRLRSENRRIRDWAARNVRKYIIEGCQLNGIYFEEISPRWTSQQDSRTGAPGIRCQDVPVSDFVKWKKAIDSAKKGARARDKFLVALDKLYGAMNEAERRPAQTVRIPNKGGDLFVSADPKSSAANGIQADLNAAANIGLRALIDPDWIGAWWYVLVKLEDGTTDPKDFPGCPLFEKPLVLIESVVRQEKPDGKSDRKDAREKSYVWLGISSDPFDSRRNGWKVTPEYWNSVEFQVVKRFAKTMNLTLE